MKQNACYFCRIAARRAWDTVTRFLKSPPPFVHESYIHLLHYRVRLAYRVGIEEKHTQAGFLLQELLNPRWMVALKEAERIEYENSITHPYYISQIMKAVGRATKVIPGGDAVDVSRYAPHLDKELIDELLGEDR